MTQTILGGFLLKTSIDFESLDMKLGTLPNVSFGN